MRIVIDGRYLCNKESGIGKYVRALVTRIPELAPDLDFRIWTGPDWNDVQTPPRVQLHPVRSKATGLMTLFGVRWLDRLTPSDLFHSTANVLGFGVPCPTVVTVHDTMWLDRIDECQPIQCLRPVSRTYFKAGIGHALRRAKRIVTVSHASAKCIEQVDARVAERVRVIHHGFEPCFRPCDSPTLTRKQASRILGFDGDYLLVVGQNQPSKGHDIVLRAFARSGLKNTRLVFVQRLSAGRCLRDRVRDSGLADHVRFVAELEAEAFLPVLQSALGLLQPSSSEGFGLPVLEAMACGCPVIASDIEPLREVLEDASSYAAVGDLEDWRRAMVRLVSDPEQRALLRQRGIRRARSFSWERAARATLDVYREVIHERTRG